MRAAINVWLNASGVGGQHRPRDEGTQDGVLRFLGQHLGRDDAHARSQRDATALEHETEGQRELQEEVDVAPHRDHRLAAPVARRKQELDGVRRDDEERKGAAGDEESATRR